MKVTRTGVLSAGTAFVLGGAVVAGVLGFALTFVVARVIGVAHVAEFSAVWSGTYLVVGSLAGIQQEVARAARRPGEVARANLTRLVVATSTATLFVAAAAAAVWVFPVFGASGWRYIPPLAIGPAGFVVVAFIVGSLYGVHAWKDIALLVTADAILRLLAVCLVLVATHDVFWISWAIAIPFGLSVVLLAPRINGALRGGVALDVNGIQLLRNAAKSVGASFATAVMVSGFSLILVATGSGESAVLIGSIAFAVTVVRAPIMVGVSAAQSLLIVRFRDARQPVRAAAMLVLIVTALGVMLAVIAFAVGDQVLSAIVGPRYSVGGGTLALIVASSALVGMLFISGPLLLALRHHTVYALGWAVAALLTVVILLTPLDFFVRLGLSLLVPPVAGFVVHGAGLRAVRRGSQVEPTPTPSP